MSVRVDYEQIKNAWSDEIAIFCANRRAMHILLSAIDQFHWGATYDHSPVWEADRDYVDFILDELTANAGVAMSLSDLISYIDEVESLLTEIRDSPPCCQGNYDPSNGQFYTDAVVDGSGTVPQNIVDAGYATDTSDWSGFDDYKCMIAHVAITSLESKIRQIADITDAAGLIAGGTVAVFGIITGIWTGGLSLLVIGILTAAATAFELYEELSQSSNDALLQLADKVATNHDALACAIYLADGTEDAITDLNAKIDELFSLSEAIILKNANTQGDLRTLYGGRYDAQNVAQKLQDEGYVTSDYTCDCIEPETMRYDFPNDRQDWTTGGINTAWISPSYIRIVANSTDAERLAASETGSQAASRFGISTPLQCSKIKVRFMFDSQGSTQIFQRWNIQAIEAVTEVGYKSPNYDTNGYAYDTWHEVTYDLGQQIDLRTGSPHSNLYHYRDAPASGGQRVLIDWIAYVT